MGGELLASQEKPQKYSDIFNEVFPYYLYIGMTEAQFWNGDVWLVKAYRKAYDLKRQEQNQMLWLQGLYIYEAIANLSPLLRAFTKNPKPIPYPSEPYPLDKKDIEDKKEKEHEQAKTMQKDKLLAWAKAVNKKKEKQDG